jgi:hypothetical protein
LQAARDRAADAPEVDELVDSDVPAAVVCARCGEADCPGCVNALMRSGFVSVVPWERPGSSVLARLWTTASATTLEAEPFFAELPDGPIAPALRFAVLSELIASTAMALFAAIPVAILAPSWLMHVLRDDGLLVARLVAMGIPGLAALLVAAHTAHGWALDRGARRPDVPSQATRALRFGLYSAGWDLVLGPLGVGVVLAKHGVTKALGLVNLGVGLPGRSARAFLRGCYRLDGKDAEPALRASMVAAVLATLFGTVAILGGVVVAVVLCAS